MKPPPSPLGSRKYGYKHLKTATLIKDVAKPINLLPAPKKIEVKPPVLQTPVFTPVIRTEVFKPAKTPVVQEPVPTPVATPVTQEPIQLPPNALPLRQILEQLNPRPRVTTTR